MGLCSFDGSALVLLEHIADSKSTIAFANLLSVKYTGYKRACTPPSPREQKQPSPRPRDGALRVSNSMRALAAA